MKTKIITAVAGWIALACPGLQAQVAPAPTGAASTSDETVQLSPFDVSANQAQGYATTSASSASRVAVPITDMPSSVVVLDEKLIGDLMATSAADTLNLVGGVSAYSNSASQQSNTFSMRGFASSSADRDGFEDLLFGSSGGFNYTYIDRIEVLKGPNGILYGDNDQGGIVNLISKKPLADPQGSFQAMFGSYGFEQYTLDDSNFFDSAHQWGYRLSLSYKNWDGPMDLRNDWHKPSYTANPVIRFRTKNGFEIWVWNTWVQDGSPRLNPILRGFQGATPGTGVFYTPSPSMQVAQTNASQVHTENYEVGATKTVNLGNVKLDIRLLGRYIDWFNSGADINATGNDTYVGHNGQVIGQDGRTIPFSEVDDNISGVYRTGLQTSKTSTTEHSYTYASDFNFTFDTGPIHNQLLAFAAYDRLDEVSEPGIDGKVYAATTTAALAKLGVDVSTGTARVWMYPYYMDTTAGIPIGALEADANSVTTQSATVQNNDEYSSGAVERMSFLQNRVFVVGGLRFTELDTINQTGAAAAVRTADPGWQDSYATLVKVYEGAFGQASLFFDTNETFVPDFTIDKRLATYGAKLPDSVVKMTELGTKYDMLDSRFVATAAMYQGTESNLLETETDVTGAVTGVVNSTYSVPVGTEQIWGWDCDLAAHLLPGLDAIASAGETTAHIPGPTLGTYIRTTSMPSNTMAAFLRYEVQSGPLKNASLGWNFTYWGSSMLNSRTYWLLPPGYTSAAILGYHWKQMTYQLRVDNVFNQQKLLPSVNETAVVYTYTRNFKFAIGYHW